MPDYSGALYSSLPPVIYRIDNTFPVKGWFTKERLYVHVMTNNNGDSVITEAEKKLAFNTKAYPDGSYRLIVEVCDAADNCTTDSQDVVFRNGIIVQTEQGAATDPVTGFGIERRLYDGSGILLTFQVPVTAAIKMQVVNFSGCIVRKLISKKMGHGSYTVRWDGMTDAGHRVSPGTYIVMLEAGGRISSAKVQRP
jgi:hypothetical protein